jgi:hypothetical protein
MYFFPGLKTLNYTIRHSLNIHSLFNWTLTTGYFLRHGSDSTDSNTRAGVPDYRLLYDAFSICIITESNGRIINEWWIGTNLEGSGRGLTEASYRHLARRTKEFYKISSHDRQCFGWDSNREPPEQISTALRIHQPARRDTKGLVWYYKGALITLHSHL